MSADERTHREAAMGLREYPRGVFEAMIAALRLHNIVSINFDNSEDALEVELHVPIDVESGVGRTFSHTETIEYSDETPEYLQEATRAFTQAVLRMVQERETEKKLPCVTCVSSCCREGWDIRVTPDDVVRMMDGGVDVEQAVTFYRQDRAAVATGFSGLMKDEARTDDHSTVPSPRACKQLSATDGCTIHAHRPTVCREFWAYECDMHREDPRKKALQEAGRRSLPVLAR